MNDRADIRVIAPGMLSTIQDLGRRGSSAIGVGRGGAVDTLSLRVGNRLVGNDDGAAAIEMTWTGGTFEFSRDVFAALTGGEVDGRVEHANETRAVAMCDPVWLRSGDQLVMGPIQSGVRTYLCVAGGIDVPIVLTSRSTHLVGAFGGLAGRPLRTGDTLIVGGDRAVDSTVNNATRARDYCNAILSRRTMRAVEGAQHEQFNADVIETFWSSAFEVSMQSDRAGLRLSGRIGQSALGGRMVSEGMMLGAVQVPESGEPIVLMVDHPTTGGYPVIACVASVDHAVLGQLRPRERIRFERVTLEEARKLYLAQEQALNEVIPARVASRGAIA